MADLDLTGLARGFVLTDIALALATNHIRRQLGSRIGGPVRSARLQRYPVPENHGFIPAESPKSPVP